MFRNKAWARTRIHIHRQNLSFHHCITTCQNRRKIHFFLSFFQMLQWHVLVVLRKSGKRWCGRFYLIIGIFMGTQMEKNSIETIIHTHTHVKLNEACILTACLSKLIDLFVFLIHSFCFCKTKQTNLPCLIGKREYILPSVFIWLASNFLTNFSFHCLKTNLQNWINLNIKKTILAILSEIRNIRYAPKLNSFIFDSHSLQSNSIRLG